MKLHVMTTGQTVKVRYGKHRNKIGQIIMSYLYADHKGARQILRVRFNRCIGIREFTPDWLEVSA